MKEIVTRALSGTVYVLFLVSAIFYDPLVFTALIGLFSFLALWEFLRLLRLPFLPFFLLHLSLFIAPVYFSLPSQWILSFLGAVILTNLWVAKRCFQKTQASLNTAEKSLLAFFYLTGSSVFIALIHSITWEGLPLYIFWLYLAIWTNNTFAYLVGSRFGKTKIFPAISPKKSYEGYWGGAVFTFGLVFAIEYFYGAFGSIWWGIGLGIPFFATLGDFIQSYFKRRVNVKDSGHWLPGHGGFYDRMDSIIFTAPFFYLLLKLL